MSQTLLLVVLFVAAMAALPWLVRRIQQRQAGGGMASGGASKVLSAVAVGPHQRVVTVEVGPEHCRTLLVLGVTAQQVNCLHVMPPQPAGPMAPGAAATSFASEIQRQTAEPAHAAVTAAGTAHAQ